MAHSEMIEMLLDLWDGGVSIPPAIEQAISALAGSDPMSWSAPLVAAVNTDYHALPRSKTALASLTPDQRYGLAQRLGWVIRTLSSSGHHHLQQPQNANPALEAALYVAACWDEGGSFWAAAGHKIDEKRVWRSRSARR